MVHFPTECTNEVCWKMGLFFFNQDNRTDVCHQQDGIGGVSEAWRKLYTLGLNELSASHGIFQLDHMSKYIRGFCQTDKA